MYKAIWIMHLSGSSSVLPYFSDKFATKCIYFPWSAHRTWFNHCFPERGSL